MKTFVLSILFAASACAQRPEFEVASLKPNPGGKGIGMAAMPGGKIEGTNVPLRRFIAVAYSVTDFQIFGNINWLDSERYDIDARAGHPVALPELRLMLQSLIEDRFKLKVHKEPRELQTYTLMPAKGGVPGGSGLVKAPEGDCASTASPQAALSNGTPCGVVNLNPRAAWIHGQRARISQLADRLSTLLGCTVVDKSGLTGLYNITIAFAPDPNLTPGVALPDDAASPSLFTALQEQAGLKLTKGKGPVDVIVIDSAEKATAN